MTKQISAENKSVKKEKHTFADKKCISHQKVYFSENARICLPVEFSYFLSCVYNITTFFLPPSFLIYPSSLSFNL